jgi:hypothetical protein
MSRKGNRWAEAFKENFNVVGLAGAAALAAATLNPLPLLVGVVAEAAYLLFVPDSGWYQARLARRFDAEVEQRRRQLKEQVFPSLRPEMQERFTRLEATRDQINAQPVRGEEWFQEVQRKLDYLLEKFLMFGSKETQFRSYLRSALNDIRAARPGGGRRKSDAEFDREFQEMRGGGAAAGGAKTRRIPINQPGASGRERDDAPPASTPEHARWIQQSVAELQAHYEREAGEVKALLEAEQDLDTKAILEKRADVLERRHESFGKMGKILTNLHHQLELLEDTFGLINDQVRARSPEQVLADIDGVVWQTDTMTKLLEELAPYEQMADRLAA